MLWRSYKNTPVSATSGPALEKHSRSPLLLHEILQLDRESWIIISRLSPAHLTFMSSVRAPGALLPGILAYLPLPGMSFFHLDLHMFKSCSFSHAPFEFLYRHCSHFWTPLPTSGYQLAIPDVSWHVVYCAIHSVHHALPGVVSLFV